jgi:Trypsin-like peptidase domain
VLPEGAATDMKTATKVFSAILVVLNCWCAAWAQTVNGSSSVEQATVYIECLLGTGKTKGTGVIISPDGLVLTAKHVVPDGSHCGGEIGRPSPNPSFLLTLDPHRWGDWDIIALRLAKEQGRTFPFVNYRKIGDELKGASIIARGIKENGTEIAVSPGVISTANIDARGMIGTTALTSSGMSGGPVVLSADGSLIGIVAGADFDRNTGAPSSYGVLAVQLVAADLGLTESQGLLLRPSDGPCKPEACQIYVNVFQLGMEAKLYRMADQIFSLTAKSGAHPSGSELKLLSDNLHLDLDIEKLASGRGKGNESNVEALLRDKLQTVFPADIVNIFDVGIRVGGAVGAGLPAPTLTQSGQTVQSVTPPAQQWNDDLAFINSAIGRLGAPKIELSVKNGGKDNLSTAACSAADSISSYFLKVASKCTDNLARYRSELERVTPVTNSASPHEGVRINGKRLVYFTKASDYETVKNALAAHNLYYEEQAGTSDQATNVITCQPNDDIEKIKWLAGILLDAGVRLQGIAPQARKTNLIGIEYYPQYARMPVLNSYLLSVIKHCPDWVPDQLPSKYVSLTNKCDIPIYGTVTYADPFASSWISQIVSISAYSTWFLTNQNGVYPSSQFSYVYLLYPNGRQIAWRIGQTICS